MRPITGQADIEQAAALFARIDSTGAFMFRAGMADGADPPLAAFLLHEGGGAFYAAADGAFAYAAGEDDTDGLNGAICALYRQYAPRLKPDATVWLPHDNRRLTAALTACGLRPADAGMTEFYLPRAAMAEASAPFPLARRGYEPARLDVYVRLLQDTMTYHTFDYVSRREEYAAAWAEKDARGYFAAYWAEDALAGLCVRGWQAGDEIEWLAVSPAHQRRGLGGYMLHMAAAELFAATDKPGLYLYCMDANAAAQRFYRQRGLTVLGHAMKLCAGI